MNADALLHTIRVKVPSGSDLGETLATLWDKISRGKAKRAFGGAPATNLDGVARFQAMMASAVVEPPRRLAWHRLAVLDFALTAAVILGGGVCAWALIDMLFGFLAW